MSAPLSYGSVGAQLSLSGRLRPGPRSGGALCLSVVTLWFFVRPLLELFSRWVLRRETQATLSLRDGRLFLEQETQLWGRSWSRAQRWIPLAAIQEIRLEQAGARAQVRLGISALFLGTCLGSGLLLESLRAPASLPGLAACGLLLLAGGLFVDWALHRGTVLRKEGLPTLTVRCLRGPSWSLQGVNRETTELLLERLFAESHTDCPHTDAGTSLAVDERVEAAPLQPVAQSQSDRAG